MGSTSNAKTSTKKASKTKKSAASEAVSHLSENILALREELMSSSMTPKEIQGILEAFAARPNVELIKPIELWSDQDIEDEAKRRDVNWLALETDDDLMAEVEHRQLVQNKNSLTEEEFEREAERRGYRNSLAEYSIEEIQSYLRLQGHSGNNNNNYNRNNGRSRKKRHKGRRN